MKRRYAHIINAVRVGQESDLSQAQPIAFEAMRQAREFCHDSEVDFYGACFPEDRDYLPDFFIPTRDLERSVLDCGAFVNQRKLPILGDIFQRVGESSQADYIIYTNSDIIPLPSFYSVVDQCVRDGIDSMVINRRTIPAGPYTPQDLPIVCAQVGQTHLGWDCFVFPRAMLSQMSLGLGCIGAPRIGMILIANLLHLSSNFREWQNWHVTVHIGDAGAWIVSPCLEYREHNTLELLSVLKKLLGEGCVLTHQGPLGDFFRELYRTRSVGLKDLFDRLLMEQ